MGRFLIFVAVVLILALLGLGVWWVGNQVYMSIKLDDEKFEVNKTVIEKIKEDIKKEN